MIPLGDDNPTRITPIITWVLILINIAVFIWEMLLDPRIYEQMIQKYGFVPVLIASGESYYTFVTSMFMHGGILHLAGNMWYMHVFGDNVEDLCGYVPYLALYLTCGFVGSLFQLVAEWGAAIPAIGASGAISGLLGAYVYLFPNVRIRTAITWGFFMRIARLPAYFLIGFWFLYQIILGMLATGTSIAYWAHIGGFIAGLVLARIFVRRREVHPLFRTRYFTYWDKSDSHQPCIVHRTTRVCEGTSEIQQRRIPLSISVRFSNPNTFVRPGPYEFKRRDEVWN